MRNNESRPWAEKSNAELREMIADAEARLVTTGGHTKRLRIMGRIVALQFTLDQREEDSVASGYADYLEGLYGEDR